MPDYHTDLSLLQRGFFYGLSICFGSYIALCLSTWIDGKPLSVKEDESNSVDDNSIDDKSSVLPTRAKSITGGKASTFNTLSTRTILHHICVLGSILLYAWINEHTELVPKIDKHYDIDLFWFLFGLLLLAAVLTIRPSRGNADVLNRDQTEEWKGWMQFLFLLYHHQHATAVYNLIRVFVSAYVWMTGFGNFSFFYMRADYSFTRFLQMMWRLNFLVLIIIPVMGTNYILYYIVPLHTFYFLCVLSTCAIFKSINYTGWGPRLKIFVFAVIIYVVWELEQVVPGIFDTVFWPVKWILQESNGSLHEWHFRTFLDHYSTLFGMIFAMNFPYLTSWFVRVERLSPARCVALKTLVGGLFIVLIYWWYVKVFSLTKYDFNAAHPYWMWIPILAFIYFRNITPTFRSYHSAFLNYLGKITLETYLLQFHVFLAARRPGLPWAPTKLIALLPNWPFCNMLLCGLIFIGCARLSFLATLTLRDEILSSASSRQWQSRALITLASFALFALLALVLPFNDDVLLGICCGLIVLSFLLAFALDWRKSNLF